MFKHLKPCFCTSCFREEAHAKKCTIVIPDVVPVPVPCCVQFARTITATFGSPPPPGRVVVLSGEITPFAGHNESFPPDCVTAYSCSAVLDANFFQHDVYRFKSCTSGCITITINSPGSFEIDAFILSPPLPLPNACMNAKSQGIGNNPLSLFVPANTIPPGQAFDLWITLSPRVPSPYTIAISQEGC